MVLSATGRREVPIAALCDLRERVEEEKRSGRRRLHALEPAMVESRRRAERFRPDPSLRAELESGQSDRHRISDLRSLAYHRALGPRLRRPMIERARLKVDRWDREEKIDSRHASEWRTLLDLPLEEIRVAIGADDDRGRDLRQNSPLAGLVSEPERRKIFETVREHAQS